MSLLSSSSAFRTYIGPSRKRASSSTYTSHKRGRGANRRSSIATSRRRTFSWIRTSARGCPTLGSRGSWTGDALGLTPVSWERGGERGTEKKRKKTLVFLSLREMWWYLFNFIFSTAERCCYLQPLFFGPPRPGVRHGHEVWLALVDLTSAAVVMFHFFLKRVGSFCLLAICLVVAYLGHGVDCSSGRTFTFLQISILLTRVLLRQLRNLRKTMAGAHLRY